MDRFVPANPEAELAVLGSLLIDPDALVDVMTVLKPEDFYSERHQWIYQAILALSAKRQPADFVTVCDELERRKQLDEVGGAAYVMDLINAVPTAIHARHYAQKVEEQAVLRKLIRAAGQIAQVAYESAADVDAACAKALALVEEATERRTANNAASISPVIDRAVEQFESNAQTIAEGGQVSIPWGLRELDRLTGGIWPSDVVVLAAVPKCGKSALAINVAHRVAKQGIPTAVFSLEMQDIQVAERVLSPVTGYSVLELRKGEILDWDALKAAAKTAKTDLMFVDDAPALSVAELAARVKRLHAREGVRLVIVDYVQLLSGGRRFENRVQELGHISRSLKALAKELDIAIIAVAQLNREYAKRQNQKPTSADLEGSSQWEKDASTVVFIYRDNDPMVAERDVNSATIIVDRSRNGSSGEFVIGWHGKTTQFTDEPIPLDSSDAAAYRKELALKCQALPLTWDSWLLHESGYDEVLKQARQAYAGMKDGVRDAVKPLLQSWSNGHVDREALKRLQQVRNGDLLLAAIASISARKILLEDVRNWVVPALLDKNFAVFHGPSGRGKTQMARIIQSMVIAECGMPAVWLNWRKFTRQVKDTFNGNGTEHEVWRQSRAPVLILDDPDKVILNEWNTGQLYDVLDEAGNINGTPRGVLLVLNHTPKEFTSELAAQGYIGEAVAQRAFRRNKPIVVDFSIAPIWEPSAPQF